MLRELKEKMQEASGEMEFERAIEYRELLNSVSQIAQKQKITNTDGEDKDIIALASDDRDAVVQVFLSAVERLSEGIISCARGIGRKHGRYSGKFRETVLFWDAVCPAGNHAPGSNRRHSGAGRMAECQTRAESDDTDSAERTQRKAGGAGCENAQLVLSQDKEKIKREEGRTIGAVKEIEQLLGMKDLNRMEAYDISNINGFETVGSMIVYEKGRPKRSDYRKFKLRTVSGPDDYASMHEVLTRRFTHGMQEQKELEEKICHRKSAVLHASRISL